MMEPVEPVEPEAGYKSRIMKELAEDALISNEKEILDDLISDIQYILQTTKSSIELCEKFVYLKHECDKSLAHKIIAVERGTYFMILTALENSDDNFDLVFSGINALKSIMAGQPDVLEERGIKIMMYYLDIMPDTSSERLVLKWAKECCRENERNCQQIFEHGIVDQLEKFVALDRISTVIVDSCDLIRTLVIDEDVQTEHCNAHERAKVMAQRLVVPLIQLVFEFKREESVVIVLLDTLCYLIVEEEFSGNFEAAGGILILTDILTRYFYSSKCMLASLQLITSLAKNQTVQNILMFYGIGPIITHAIFYHRITAPIVAAGCACLAALSFNNPSIGTKLCTVGAAEVITMGMRVHPDDVSVQKNGSWAIRNIITRHSCLTNKFISVGAKEVLQAAADKENNQWDYDVKAALKELRPHHHSENEV